MTIYWRHYQQSSASITGTFVQTANDPGTHVKAVGGYCHPQGIWDSVDANPAVSWPSGTETSGNHAYYPISGTLKVQDSPGGQLTTYMLIAFAVPPGEAFNAHIWWELES